MVRDVKYRSEVKVRTKKRPLNLAIMLSCSLGMSGMVEARLKLSEA